MSANTTNILIVGVGGQGTLMASRVLAQAAVDLGHDVKVSEIHGMAQRGGSVVSQVRYGPKVFSPIIKMGEADVIMAFEKLEAARYLPYLRKDGFIIINTESIDPLPVMSGAAVYPESLEEKIAAVVPNTVVLDASGIAEGCGTIIAANIVMVGRVVKALQMSKDSLAEAIKTLVPSKAIDINLRALDAGWNLMDNKII
ncbi:MAG: indolepyruvate oxidoreductase subunit beta [Syntrophomonadaceae bacterium]|nr:indolepyruvate oxidoreductase subunit beta [Syntrophomonadaceae bacterium]